MSRATAEQKLQEQFLVRREHELREREMELVERELNIIILQQTMKQPVVKKRKGRFHRSHIKHLRTGDISDPMGRFALDEQH